MSWPLIILAVLSVIGGFLGPLALFGLHSWSPLGNFLSINTAPELSIGLDWLSTGLSLLLALLGIGLAWRLYGNGFEYKENHNPLYRFLLNKCYVDEILTIILIRPVLALGRGLTRFVEGGLLDGGSRGIANAFSGTSTGTAQVPDRLYAELCSGNPVWGPADRCLCSLLCGEGVAVYVFSVADYLLPVAGRHCPPLYPAERLRLFVGRPWGLRG